MRDQERTTLFVDFSHLTIHDAELADAIKEHAKFEAFPEGFDPHLGSQTYPEVCTSIKS